MKMIVPDSGHDLEQLCADMGAEVPLPLFSPSITDQLSYHALQETLACPLALTIATEMDVCTVTSLPEAKQHVPQHADATCMDSTIEAVRKQMDAESAGHDTASNASDDGGACDTNTSDDGDDDVDDDAEYGNSNNDGYHGHDQHGHRAVDPPPCSSRRSARASRTRPCTTRRTKQTAASKRAGKAGCSGNNPTLPIPANAVLATDHVIARGRRRRIQLSKMSKEQIAIETEARMEKNRQLARDCRRRKKMKITLLEDKVSAYERTINRQTSHISRLEDEVAKLRALVSH